MAHSLPESGLFTKKAALRQRVKRVAYVWVVQEFRKHHLRTPRAF